MGWLEERGKALLAAEAKKPVPAGSTFKAVAPAVGPDMPAKTQPATAQPKAAPQSALPPTEVSLVAEPKDEKLYPREVEERTAFNADNHSRLKGTVPRIEFEATLMSTTPSTGATDTAEADPCAGEGHMSGYVWGLGLRPKTARGKLSLVKEDGPEEVEGPDEGDGVYSQLSGDEGALALLQRYSLDAEKGPYAERQADSGENLVQFFADTIFKGVRRDELFKLIERIIDNRPFVGPEMEMKFPRTTQSPVGFILRKDWMPPDELPTAGNILSQKRMMEFKRTQKFQLVHPLEPYILAVAALRQYGYEAYPAVASVTNVEGDQGFASPIIVVMDPKGLSPLTTFDMKRMHPVMDTLDIISDTAMMGICHVMLAETRMKHFSAEIVGAGKKGTILPMEDVKMQLERISRPLFESMRRWDINPFISDSLGFLHSIVGNSVLEAQMEIHNVVDGAQSAQLVRDAVRGLVQRRIDPYTVSTDDPVLTQAAGALMAACEAQTNYLETVQTMLQAHIGKAGWKKEE